MYLISFDFISIDVNLIGHDGETPLHTAARYEIPDNSDPTNTVQNTITYLVSHQANLSKRDNHGELPVNFHA
jgi:hypothetical protein